MREKHEVNVKENSLINFQIGLIATLIFVYVMFEVFTASKAMVGFVDIPPIDDSDDIAIVYTIIPNSPVKKKVVKAVSRKKYPVLNDVIKKVDNAKEDVEEKTI